MSNVGYCMHMSTSRLILSCLLLLLLLLLLLAAMTYNQVH